MSFSSANALMAAEYAQEEQGMQRDKQEFMEAQSKAQAKAEKKAQKASLWSGLGSTLGGLGAGAITSALMAAGTIATGGLAAPLIAALITGAGTYAGSKVGSSASDGQLFRDKRVKMKEMNFGGGKFMTGKRQAFSGQMKDEKDALKDYQDTAAELLNQSQLTGALTSAATAGFGSYTDGLDKASKLGKAGKALETTNKFSPALKASYDYYAANNKPTGGVGFGQNYDPWNN